MKRGGCPIRSREVGQGQSADHFQDGRPDPPDVRTPRERKGDGGGGGGGGGGRLLHTPPQDKRLKRGTHTARSLQANTSKTTWRLEFGDAELEREATPTKVVFIW